MYGNPQALPSNGLATCFLQNIKNTIMARNRVARVIVLKQSYGQRSYFAQEIPKPSRSLIWQNINFDPTGDLADLPKTGHIYHSESNST